VCEKQHSAQDGIDQTKKLAQVVALDESSFRESGIIKYSKRRSGYHDFGLLDSIILAIARGLGEKLLTLDSYFEGKDDCLILTI